MLILKMHELFHFPVFYDVLGKVYMKIHII